MLTTADSLWIGVSIVESLAFAHTFSDPGESEPLWYRYSYPHFIHPIRYSVLGRTKLELKTKKCFEGACCHSGFGRLPLPPDEENFADSLNRHFSHTQLYE